MANPPQAKRLDLAKMKENYAGYKPREYHLDTTGLSELKFGKELREKEFLLKPGIAFLNHGSYGAVPKRILELQAEYNKEREEHPDLWYRLNAKKYMDQAREVVADFIGADLENVLLVDNVTSAINVVMRSYPFKSGDIVLDATLTYGSISYLCADFTSRIRPDVQRLKLQLKLPIENEEQIIKKYEESLQQNPGIKMVIIDNITSPTALVMPMKRIVELCHQHDALAVIDGAHAIGQVPLDMKHIGADFFTSNLHKWCYSPRGAAFLCFDSKHSSWLHPANTSWKIGQSLDQQFFDQGTRDHVPFICCRHGLEFYNAIGGMDKIISYTRDLADQAVEMLTKEVGLHSLEIPKSMEAPNMRLVKLPPFSKYPFTDDNMWDLHEALFGNSNVFGILVPVEGAIYFRLSVQVYNDLDDMKALVKIFKDFIKENA